MTTAVRSRRGFDWESAATVIAKTLDEYNALVVVGVDPVITGRIAVAIGRAQAAKRRVAVGDLFAESPPIQALVETDDPHGIVDSFLYGVSLSRIAYPVADSGQLYVMPSGTEAPVYEEILPNSRWQRLAAGFREVGALLILAAPAGAPHIEALVSATDGAILVGDGVPSKLPVVRVISAVRETPAKGFEMPPELFEEPKAKRSWRRVAIGSGILLTLVLAALAFWLARRPFASPQRRLGPLPDTTHAPVGVKIAPADTAAIASGSEPVVTTVTLSIANPQDSTGASAFGVELMAANTQAAAILKLQTDGKKLPAATFAPVLDAQGSRWFKVITGASTNRAEAEALLARLRKEKMLDSVSGAVVRLPFAFRVDSGVPAAATNELVAMYNGRGQPAYALRQADGTAWLLIGAFESVEQSELYAESLRSSGIPLVLVYRKGRMF